MVDSDAALTLATGPSALGQRCFSVAFGQGLLNRMQCTAVEEMSPSQTVYPKKHASYLRVWGNCQSKRSIQVWIGIGSKPEIWLKSAGSATYGRWHRCRDLPRPDT